MSQQDEKSQVKNRAKAMKVLRSRLYEAELQKQNDAIAKERKGQVGTGDRSEKIRTYNFPQSRVTDHRINFTTHQLHGVLDGNLDELIGALTTYYTAEKLREVTETQVTIREKINAVPGAAWRPPASNTAKPAAMPTCWPATSSAGTAPQLMTREHDDGRRRRSSSATIALIERRARREPVAYIRGDQEFWSRDYAVTPAVLIPRPETELIIEEFLARLPSMRRQARAASSTSAPAAAASRSRLAAERPSSKVDRDRYFAAALRRRARQCGAPRRRRPHRVPRSGVPVGATGAVRFHPVQSAVRDRSRVREPAAGSARIRAGARRWSAGEDGFRDIRQIVDLAHGAARARRDDC